MNFRSRLKQAAKNILPVNTIRRLRALKNQGRMRRMAETPKVPFERDAFPEGINLIGCIRQKTGLGQACRLTAAQLLESGIPASLTSFSVSEDYGGATEYDHQLSGGAPYGVNLFFINMQEFLQAFEQISRSQWERHYNIAFWNWEAERFPEYWIPLLSQVDEVWTPSEFTADAVRTVTGKTVVSVPYHIPHPVCSGAGRERFGLPEDCFLVLILFDNNSYSERKNPQAAVEAFRKAFPEKQSDVGLVIKVNAPDAHLLRELRESLKDRRVWFLDELYSREDLNELIRCCDVYVSLHRAEGFGLVLAEAMALGVPTVATAYSANTEFQSEDSACLVRCELREIGKDLWPFRKDYIWAEADTDQAAAYLRRLKEDSEYRKMISENGKKKIAETLGKARIQEIMRNRFREIMG